MKIIVDATYFPDPYLQRAISEFGDDTDFVMLVNNHSLWNTSDFKGSFSNMKFVNYTSFRNFSDYDYGKARGEVIELVDKIMNDHQTLLLSNRYGRFGNYGPGIFHYIRYLTALVSNAFQFLEAEKPDFVIFRTTPHSLQEWPLANVAEHLAIPVLVSEVSVLPWRQNLNLGFRKDRQIVTSLAPTPCSHEELTYMKQYFNIVSQGYDEIMPGYERTRLLRNNNKYYNIKNEIIDYWKRPDKIYNKHRCYKAHQKVAINDLPEAPFFSFFLHYQPERTSMPDGFGFSQQILAIHALRIALPSDIKIIVKEHPATFTNQCLPRDRHPSFYYDISAIDNVDIIDVGFDPFVLMDNSVGVATITGTAGRQAMIRNKPVIFFGRSVYKNIEGTHEYSSMKALKEFINGISVFTGTSLIRENVWKEFEHSLTYSYTGYVHHLMKKNDFIRLEYFDQAFESLIKAFLQKKGI